MENMTKSGLPNSGLRYVDAAPEKLDYSDICGITSPVVGREAVSGGDINRAYRLRFSDGESVFLKCNRPGLLDMFTSEALGLEALRSARAVGVPRPLAVGADGNEAFLILEYLESGRRRHDYWEVFGRELASLHRAAREPFPGGRFGFFADNYIGSTPQHNAPSDSWTSFFRERRLQPQIELAWGLLDGTARRDLESVILRLDRLLPEPEFPSLIHGDLWSGNVLCGPDGKAWIMDPAAYVGHFEAELAMTELFGGFPERFYSAYSEVNPIDRAYRQRRELYNLYHLLNHLNLFGSMYLGEVRAVAKRYA